MRRTSKKHSGKLPLESQRLCALAKALSQADSRMEARAWESQLDTLVRKLLKADHQGALDSAFDQLFEQDPLAYEALMDTIECNASSTVMQHAGQSFDVMLIAVPILAWTRFAIGSGPIAADTLAALQAQLHGHVLADGVTLTLAPTLFAIDQLPHTHAQTYAMTQRMASTVLDGGTRRAATNLPATTPFLADTRYLLGAVATPSNGPIFRWQTADMPADVEALKATALAELTPQILPSIERLLPGCGLEILLPQAYFSACREGDLKIRPVSIRAAIHFITHILEVEAAQLTAIIAGFSEQAETDIDEYRIGFSRKNHKDVVYGIVWPLYGDEESGASAAPNQRLEEPIPSVRTPLEEIQFLLKENGVAKIVHHEELFPMEFCDDCGSPLFCDIDGELVHPEMPEEAEQTYGHLH